MYYDKKIKYLNYMERGEKIRGCGFLKVEVRDDSLNLEIQVNGLPLENSGTGDIILQLPKGEQTIGKILLKNGRGEFKVQYNHLSSVFEPGDYEAWRGLRITLEGDGEVCGFWGDDARWMAGGVVGSVGSRREKLMEAVSEVADTSGTDGGPMIQTVVHKEEVTMQEMVWGGDVGTAEKNRQGEEVGEQERIWGGGVRGTERKLPGKDAGGVEGVWREAIRVSENNRQREEAEEVEKIWGKEVRTSKKNLQGEETGGAESIWGEAIRVSEENQQREEAGETKRQWSMVDARYSEKPAEEKISRSARQAPRSRPGMSLMEEKWQQLCEIYPHINPFRDEREYLSLSPADFVLLSANSYKKANNSFLLHGFYNYKHLLLARIERKGEIMYYVGAPGNYFEREKQVAIMFGFDSFECAVEPAQAGDFGYYMMRVEI